MFEMLLLVGSVSAGNQESRDVRSGPVPSPIVAPARIVWIAADDREPPAECAIRLPSAWTCEAPFPQSRGLIVIVGAQGGVAAIPSGLAAWGAASVVSAWGRVVRLTPGGVSREILRDVSVTAWRPLRPASRPLTRRVSAGEEPGMTVLRLSDEAFWIAGNLVDSDSYLRIDGPGLGSSRFGVAGIQDGPPEFPVYVDVSPPISLQGRVVDGHGQPVDRAVVEAWAPLHQGQGRGEENAEDKTLLHWAATRSDSQGQFDFPHMAAGQYEVIALHPSAGRAALSVSSVAEPILLKLEPSLAASGRVLRRGLAVEAARVRFVPDVAALSESVDPAMHVSEDVTSAADGRFLLPLPPVRRGVVQVIAPDGSVVRLPLPGAPGLRTVALGDIALPDARAVTLRLMDPRDCVVAAAGPLGELGLTMVRAARESGGTYLLQVPEIGTWVLGVQCGGRNYEVEPPVLGIPAEGRDAPVDIQLADPGREGA